MIRLIVALLLVPALAKAELSLEDCAGAPASSIAKLVQLELAGEPADVTLRCEGETANIVVEGTQRMTLSLAETPAAARPRLLALSIAELVATSRLEEVAPPPPPPPPAPPRPRTSSLWLEGGGLHSPSLWSRWFLAGATYGGRWLLGQADLALELGTRSTSAASMRARMLSLSLAPMLPVLRGRTSIALGLGVRAGWAWLSARSRQQDVVGKELSGPYVAPIARGVATFALAARWSLRFDVELGYVIKSVRGLDADGNSLLELAGLRSALALGVQLAL